MLEKRYFVRYLSSFDQNTEKSPWQCPFKFSNVSTATSPFVGTLNVCDKLKRASTTHWILFVVCSFTGYRLSPNALNVIVKRYSTNNRISFDDFVACCVRLKALTGLYGGLLNIIITRQREFLKSTPRMQHCAFTVNKY